LDGSVDDLDQLRFRIGRGYEGRFHSSLLGDIRGHVQKTEVSSTLERWGIAYNRLKPGQRRAPSAFPGYMNIGPDLRSELEAEMKGLNRARHTIPAATAFRALVLREMKNMIRRQLPSANDDDSVSTISASTYGGRQISQQEKSSILARNIRALDSEDWYSMLANIYTNTSEALRRLSVQVKILLDITSNLPEALKSPPRTPEPPSIDSTVSPRQSSSRLRATSSVQAEMQQALDLSSLLVEGVDLIQNQLTKVVKVRSQQNADLPLDGFLKYFTLNRLFADECEAISGRIGTGLKTVLDIQIKDFVARFGDSQRHKLIQVLDSDKWDAKDFGELESAILRRVQAGSTDDDENWLRSTWIWQAGLSTAASNGNITNGTSTSAKDKVRSAVIDEQRFILPESASAMLRSMEAFLHLAAGIPSMTPDVAIQLLDNLRQFNSRTSQLILGAGATRSAGLKNITTKHLALSSQALSFIIALIPYIREFFRRHLPSSQQSTQQTISDFDNVKRRFQDHQIAIHEKLVEIMSGRSMMHIKAMRGIDWEEAAKNASVPISPYMETLCKETTTLQRVLSKHLAESMVAGIMGPVFQNYRSQWERAFHEVELRSEKAKDRYARHHHPVAWYNTSTNFEHRLLADASTLDSRLSKLEGSSDLGIHLVNVVKNKTVVASPGAEDAANTALDTTPNPVPPANPSLDGSNATREESRKSTERPKTSGEHKS
jgi:vacuolar protein sorting-associated protein 54